MYVTTIMAVTNRNPTTDPTAMPKTVSLAAQTMEISNTINSANDNQMRKGTGKSDN